MVSREIAIETLSPLALTLVIASIVLAIFLFLCLWIYVSLAYKSIAKKNKQKSPNLAWIPLVGPCLVSVKASKMHWWPILLLIVPMVSVWGMIDFLANVTFFVFFTIWNWKMLEAIKKPGAWAISLLFAPLYLVFLGIAAWSKEEKPTRTVAKRVPAKKKATRKK